MLMHLEKLVHSVGSPKKSVTFSLVRHMTYSWQDKIPTSDEPLESLKNPHFDQFLNSCSVILSHI